MSSPRELGARVLIASSTASAALGALALGLTHWHSSDALKFLCYLVAALLASPLKMSLPGGTLSGGSPLFTLLGILEMGARDFADRAAQHGGPIFLEARPAPAARPAGIQSFPGDGIGVTYV